MRKRAYSGYASTGRGASVDKDLWEYSLGEPCNGIDDNCNGQIDEGCNSGVTKLAAADKKNSGIALNDARHENTKGTAERLTVEAIPNPSAHRFTLVIRSKDNHPLTLKVTDAGGKTVESRTALPANGSLQLGYGYRPGIYVAEVNQGKPQVPVKLVKRAD